MASCLDNCCDALIKGSKTCGTKCGEACFTCCPATRDILAGLLALTRIFFLVTPFLGVMGGIVLLATTSLVRSDELKGGVVWYLAFWACLVVAVIVAACLKEAYLWCRRHTGTGSYLPIAEPSAPQTGLKGWPRARAM